MGMMDKQLCCVLFVVNCYVQTRTAVRWKLREQKATKPGWVGLLNMFESMYENNCIILVIIYFLLYSRCGVGVGMALWIQESYVVLLDATDIHNVKGCTLTPPYLDEYGETDPGLR